MLNEPNTEPVPVGGGGGSGSAGGGGSGAGPGGMAGDISGGSHMRYIQVTPQEKEAIERVRSTLITLSLSPEFTSLILTSLFISLALVNMKTFASLGIVL